ncbi:MFS transporter [uncultured Thiodictyon sp.]|uniref:MFS transporter n=1 Tax=uncultured Thiodictyon sp. TaxID=1846217 RepID=UPI0025D45670|nr:MFS transporter [uncultured Thiodictyon sp.]
MTKLSGLFTVGFLTLNLQFALVTAIAALFFAFSGYLQFLGVNSTTVGFLLSADGLAALILQPLIAPLVHLGTARRWLIGGSCLLSAALFLMGHCTSVTLLTVARLGQGAGFICVLCALVTMMVAVIPPGMSGRAFGWVSLVRLIPYAIVPLLFDLLSITPAAFGELINLAAVAALLPMAATLLPATVPVAGVDTATAPGLLAMAASLRSRAVLMLLLSALLLLCGYAAVFFFLKQFVEGRGLAHGGLFFTIATLTMIMVRLGGSWLFDRYDKAVLCAAGLLIVAVSYGLLGLSSVGWAFLVLAGASGLGWGVAMPLQAAALFDISEPAARAMNQNLLMVMMQGGFFLGPFIGGLLITHFGYGALFTVLAVLTLVSALLMLGVKSSTTHA